MSYDRNGHRCPHNVTDLDPDTNEYYCVDCGDVIENDESEDTDTY